MSAAEVRIRLASEELHSGNTTVTLAQDFVDYTGKEITPEPTVFYKASEAAEEIILVKGTDYEVSYRDNVEPGAAAVVVTGKNRYAGVVEKEFTIREAEIEITGYEQVAVSADPGDYPGLPGTVTAYTNVGQQLMEVRWDHISDSSLDAAGIFTVYGTVVETNARIPAEVTVRGVPGEQKEQCLAASEDERIVCVPGIASEGETVAVQAANGYGFTIPPVIVMSKDGTEKDIAVTKTEEGYSFVMPAYGVTVMGTVQPLEDALYTVAFQSNGGSEVASQQIAVASGRIAEPAAPKRRGYVFAGWYRDIALTQKWNFAADKAESDLTLYAKWTEAEIVVNTDIPDYLLGHTWNLPGTIRVTMEEETFDVSVIWNAEDVAAVRAAEEPQSCTIRGVLTDQFALEAGTYNITAGFFDPWAQWAGDQRHAKVSLSDREGKELDAKEDYHISGSKDKVQFTEVELAEDGSLYLNVAPRNSGNDNCDIMISFIVITRKAEETAEYTVTFDAGDGIETVSQQVSEGDKAARPADPKRDGYTFDGWFKDEACRQAWDFDTDIVTEDITLYAGWTKQEEPDNPEKPDNPDDPDDDLRKTLGEAIRLAEMLKAEDYTKETYDVLAEAIAGAREACEAEELTDEQMQEQMDQLAQAAAGLKTVQKEQNEILLDQLEEKKQELLDKIKELEAAVGKLYA